MLFSDNEPGPVPSPVGRWDAPGNETLSDTGEGVVNERAIREGCVATAFIGRDREQAELLAGLQDAQRGRGGVFLIAGEPGIGKTALAEHLAAVPRTADPGADLFALGVAYRENAVANPHFYRVMFTPQPGDEREPGSEVPAVVSPTFAVLRDTVARLPGVPDARELALRLWSLVHGLVSLELAGLLPGTAEERRHRYVETLRGSRLSEK